MGKFTTGILLFFSFMILFTSEYASAACWNMIKGKKVPGPVTVCESPAACKGAGGHWYNNACSATPQEVQQVSVVGKKCSTLGGTYDASDVCRCPNGTEINMSGDVGQCQANNEDATNAEKCSQLGGQHTNMETYMTKQGGYGCVCAGTFNAIDVNGPSDQCSKVATTSDSSASASGMSLDQCIKKFTDAAEDCNTQADEAVLGCKQETAGDSTIGMGKDIVNMANEVYKLKQGQAAKANSVDNSSSCAMVGLTLFTVLKGMDAFKGNCDTQYGECETKCKEVTAAVKAERLTKECTQFALLPVDIAKIEKAEKSLKEKVTASTDKCVVKAKGEQNMLADALNGYSNSATQAKVCECQKVAGSATCANVPSAADCLVGGSQYGSTACLAYGDCAIGTANYSSVACQCSRDSTLAVCKTAAAAPVSNFSGIDSKAGSTTAAGLPASAGSTGADGLGDLGTFTQQKAASDTKDAAATANPGLTNASSGGGGGGGSAPGADVGGPAAAAGEPEGGAGSGGVFGQIKSMFGMGGGTSSKAGSAASKTGTKDNPDLAKWLKGQKRCMASVDDCKQVNPANREIFDIMKDRYNKLSVPLDPYLK